MMEADQVLDATQSSEGHNGADTKTVETTQNNDGKWFESTTVAPEGATEIADTVNDVVLTLEPAALKAVIEAAIYITDEPLTAEQIANAVQQPLNTVLQILGELGAEYSAADRGLAIRELAGGYKMATKPEHHESIRHFVNKLQPPLKLSLASLETLAVVAYKQPVTSPEIMEVRGVQGASVLKTLLDRRLIATAGRKNVLGKPMMYKTTREFLIQFGLNSLAELPTLKEFEELGRFALTDENYIPAKAASSVSQQEDSRQLEVDSEIATATRDLNSPSLEVVAQPVEDQQ